MTYLDIAKLSDKEYNKLPRGLRSRNPGNIVKSPTQWRGEIVGVDERFETFDTLHNGLRALVKVLNTYYVKHKIRNIHGIINRYAPPFENHTDKYAEFVAFVTGFKSNEEIAYDQFKATLPWLVRAITRMELGETPESTKKDRIWWSDVAISMEAIHDAVKDGLK